MNYFAYGSNMDPELMMARGARFASRVGAILEHHELVFNKTSGRAGFGYANVSRLRGSFVQGILYDIDESGGMDLDRCEGAPIHYERSSVSVFLVDDLREMTAMTYVAKPERTSDGLLPTREYMDSLLKGGDLLFPEYVDFLNSFETL